MYLSELLKKNPKNLSVHLVLIANNKDLFMSTFIDPSRLIETFQSKTPVLFYFCV